jgi:membrane protease YdiL (CAAX protease family)
MIDKRAVNRIGLYFITVFILLFALQIGTSFLSSLLEHGVLYDIISLSGVNIGTFVIIIPITIFMLRNLPVKKDSEKKKINLIDIIFLFIIGLGSILIINTLRIAFLGFEQNVIILPQRFSLILLFSCVVAAIAEEIIFRKIFLDRLRVFGNREAVFISAFAFGLCHMNLWSFLFAFFLGLLWGQITLYSNTVRYACILHAINNIVIIILLPLVFTAVPGVLINVICIFFILSAIVIFITKKKFIITLNDTSEGAGIKNILRSPAILSFIIISACTILFFFVVQFL